MNRKYQKCVQFFQTLDSDYAKLFEKHLMGAKKQTKSYTAQLGKIMSVILLTDILIGYLQSSESIDQFEEKVKNQWRLEMKKLKKQFEGINAQMVMGAKRRETVKMGYLSTQVARLVSKILRKSQDIKDCSEEKLFQRLHFILHGKQISLKCYELSGLKKRVITNVHSNPKAKKDTLKNSRSVFKKNIEFKNTFFPSEKQNLSKQRQKQQKNLSRPKPYEHKVKNLIDRVHSTIQTDTKKITSVTEYQVHKQTLTIKKLQGQELGQQRDILLLKPDVGQNEKIRQQRVGSRITKHIQQIMSGQKKYSKSMADQNCFIYQKRSPPKKKLLRILLPTPLSVKNY